VAMEQVLGADGLVDRVLSVSYVAALAEPERQRVAADVRAIALRHGGEVTLAYVTDCYWCQARRPGGGEVGHHA